MLGQACGDDLPGAFAQRIIQIQPLARIEFDDPVKNRTPLFHRERRNLIKHFCKAHAAPMIQLSPKSANTVKFLTKNKNAGTTPLLAKAAVAIFVLALARQSLMADEPKPAEDRNWGAGSFHQR